MWGFCVKLPAVMKILLIVPFILFFVSCRTTRQAETPQSAEGGPATAGDVIADGSQEEVDLESEFVDSEDFEAEMVEENFPSPAEGQKEVAQQEELADEDLMEESTPPKEDKQEIAEQEELVDEEDLIAPQETAEEDVAQTPKTPTEGKDTEETTADLDEEDPSLEETTPAGDLVVVQNIRYSAEDNKIYINGTGAFSYQQRENTANNQFVIEIDSAILSEGLQERPFIMKDFDTDMALLMADQKDSSTVRIVLQMRETASMPSLSVGEGGDLVISPSVGDTTLADGSGASHGDSVMQEGGGFGGDIAGEVLPAKSSEDFFLKTPRFTGRPISIHFKEVDVRDVLYFISEGTGLNMVLDDEVSGNISIKLRNVPWDQALITVMKTKKLGYVREGNVIRIMKLDSLKKNQEDIQKMLENQKVLESLKVKVIPVVYAKAGELKKHTELFLSKEGGEGGSPGSGRPRGKIVVDSETNSLIVVDTEKAIKQIEDMVKSLDKSPTQIMIEAKVVEATENFVRDVGFRWRYEGQEMNLKPFQETFGDSLEIRLDGGLNIFGDSAGGTSNIAFNLFFAPLGQLDIDLGLSEVEGTARIISAPRVMVLNGKTATISQSSQSLSPKVTVTDESSTTSTERETASLNFKVTPQITVLGSIFMNIDVTRQFFGQRDTVTRARPTFTRSAKTEVLVNNGQTVVIGGIYQYDEQRGEDGFPILRHIPILNWFFSRWTLDKQKNELLLFLTPRALNWTAKKAT